jgi:hypothetical protein
MLPVSTLPDMSDSESDESVLASIAASRATASSPDICVYVNPLLSPTQRHLKRPVPQPPTKSSAPNCQGAGDADAQSPIAMQSLSYSDSCVFITAVPITKLFAWGGGEGGGHVLRETTSRGLCGLVCPSHTEGPVRNAVL